MNSALVIAMASVIALSASGSAAPAASIDPFEIAFEAGSLSKIYTVAQDGTRLRKVTRGTHPDEDPNWSPDHKRLAFVRNVPVGKDALGDTRYREDIYIVDRDGTGLRRLVRNAYSPSWSPTRAKLAFVRGDETPMIWTVNVNGTGAKPIGNGEQPAWSPDGQQIAFSRGQDDDSGSDVWIMRSDGRGSRVLTDVVDGVTPAWSPSGREIAFAGEDPTRPGGGLYVNIVGSGALTYPISGDLGAVEPSWSPDGKHILFMGVPKNYRFATYVVRFDGRTLEGRNLTRVAISASAPCWSPDGGSIAFSVASSKDDVLTVSDAGGGKKRALVRLPEINAVDW